MSNASASSILRTATTMKINLTRFVPEMMETWMERLIHVYIESSMEINVVTFIACKRIFWLSIAFEIISYMEINLKAVSEIKL